MSEATDKIVNRTFKFGFRKRDLVWYIYGVIFGILNGVLMAQAIVEGDVAGAIFSGIIFLFVVVVSVFLPYMEQQTDFYRQRHFDLTDTIIQELVDISTAANTANNKLLVANKDLIVENENLKGEVKSLTAKLAKKVG